MLRPTLDIINTSRDMLDVFKGYNHNLQISGGEFYDMKNLTSDYYPVLSPRNKRGIYEFPENSGDSHTINGMVAKDNLCYVDGTKLYINNAAVTGLVLENSPKQLISMGAYIIIMPDKKYINTKDLTDIGNIEAFFPANEGQNVTATYEMCKNDGTVYGDITKSAAAPDEPENMQLWIDISSTPHTLKQYSEENSAWFPVATTYLKISAPGIAASFKQYDAVKISGLPSDDNQLQEFEGKISVLYGAYHDEGDGDIGRAEGTNDYIIIVSVLDETKSGVTSKLRIERTMPVMDFVIESGNRLWGCRYGTNIKGEIVNEIYASKLGDFKNWNCFMGISTDSYIASCGSDGMWTGAISYLGYPLFFKENFLHKVYGNYPSNYQVQSTECRGVQKGCGKSLAIVNERLFYKSRGGVCVYDGSLPSEISGAFGGIHYSGIDALYSDELRNGAVGGAINNKYYISMKSEFDDKWYLFVYDTSSGMWHKEDNTHAECFCACNGELYFADCADNKIKTLLGSGTKETEKVKWMAESGVIGTSLPDRKYLSRLLVRMSLEMGTEVTFSLQYDSCDEWEAVYSARGENLRSFSIPIKPKRCDHFRIRIEGVGTAKIFSITKTIEQGSDLCCEY